ncbi:P2 family phage major capsid protein [Burkholderia glumae]|uniref:P2 family phage major capsid protein n=1 Tax=Burkholderia glumae TaxID=337 RepID=UPI0020CC6682|nr:P2 family phage major capsid protein [Burkholderia glumae]MCQ0033127.1 phage major capsid protein, P2 family [Burkholderia glumae]MCQ0038160.1 phage major capsid protein, P2 family [Burkholderia glumae]
MKKETRLAYRKYAAQIAKLNDTDDVSQKFAVEPSVQQTLETKMQESSAFLKSINILPVTELEGEKLGLSVSGPIASRTDTTKAERQPIDPTALDSNRYRCEKTDYDTAITYRKLDAWAKFPDFQQRIRNVILNLPAVRVPFFPKRAMMVTKLENLSIYFQEGARRRSLIDNPKRDQIENYESSNDAYVVEDFGCGCVAENIELVAA